VLAAPIRLDGLMVGNLNALDPEPHAWSAAQRRSAETLAGIVGQLLGLAAHAARAEQRDGRGAVR
jgi:GAF domain-containing protein